MESHSSMEQQFLKKLTEVLDANMHNEHFGVSELAVQLGMSRYTLHRKVRSVVKKSVSEFIRDERLKRANELLQKQTGTVSEVAFKVGFGSVSYFNRCFSERYGFPPGEVLKGLHPSEKSVPPDYKRTFFQKLKSSKTLYILLIILLVSVAGFHLYLDLKSNNLEKSIAILPFIDDRPAAENEYILKGLREELMAKLTLLENIRLVSRQTSDQYKDSKKKIHQIGKELKANYILEGSGQTINGNSKISLRLIEVKSDKQLWSKPYEREITKENIFEVQQEIAFLVVNELGVKLSPSEISQLKQMDFINKTAYNYFLHSMNYYDIYLIEKNNFEALQQAKQYILKAIQLDSMFVRAICQLGWILHQEARFSGSKTKLDSALLMANKAIKLQPHSSRAHNLKGFLCQQNYSESKAAFENAIKYSPNDWEGYHQMGNFMCNYGEFANTVLYSLKALEINNEPIAHDWILINLNVSLAFTGHFIEAEKYREEYVLQHNNQMISANMQQFEEMMKGNFHSAIKTGLDAYKTDSTDLTTLEQLGESYLYLRDFSHSKKYYNKYMECINQLSGFKFKTDSYDFAFCNNRHSNSIGIEILPLLNITYLYFQENQKKLFETWSKAIIDNALKHEEFNTLWAQINFNKLELACVYAMNDNKQRALENIQKLTLKKICPSWLIHYLNESPVLDNIRNEAEFKETVKILEQEYQKQYQKVEEILDQSTFKL